MGNSKKKITQVAVKAAIEAQTLDVFLMLKKNVPVTELQDIISEDFKELKIEIWPELNVMQLELPGETFIDFIEMKDDDAFTAEDKEYVNSKGYECVYCVTHDADDSKTMLTIAKYLLEKFDGIIGNDTDDFEPTFDKETISNFNYNE